MEKEDGNLCLALAGRIATKQIVVFTPLGFMEQEIGEDGLDAWGMGKHTRVAGHQMNFKVGKYSLAGTTMGHIAHLQLSGT